jgi:hypothetical protein
MGDDVHSDEVERMAFGLENQASGARVRGGPFAACLLTQADAAKAARIIRTLAAERDALQAYAHAATKAITGLTPGGSEYFGKQIGDIYTADLDRCVPIIRKQMEDRTLAALASFKGGTGAL